jgi:hypothetical protein
VIAIVITGCGGTPVPEITAGVDGCSSCGMVIDRTNEACGWIDGGEFVPFCSPGCLLAEHDELRNTGQIPPQVMYFADYREGTFSTAAETAFLLTDHLPTVMNARVICFNSVAAAEATREHEDEVVTDWTGFRVQRGAPDTVIETVFGPDGMDPEVVVADKGDIVLWRAAADARDTDLVWIVKGYPEVEPPIVSPGGEKVELRFLASRPGAGFPIEADMGQALGMLKVSGAHTADEAAR